jgi:hypothetical protein
LLSAYRPRREIKWISQSGYPQHLRWGSPHSVFVFCSSLAVKGYEVEVMIIFTAIVSALVFVYLVAAMVRPEWF